MMTKTTKLNVGIIIALVLIISMVTYWVKHHHLKTQVVTPPVLVQLGSAQAIQLPNSISSSGNLEAIQHSNISSKVAGYVTKINYHEGTIAHTGDLLVQLDNSKERAAVDSAKAQDDISALKYRQSIKMYHRRLEAYDDYYGAKVNHEKDNAALETAQTALADKQIRAPFTGQVGEKSISIGDYIQPGSTLLTITNLKKLRVTYTVPAQYLNKLKIGQPITLTTETLGANVFKGHVSYISPTIDSSSQTITVHADIDNSQGLLKPGLYVALTQQLGAPQKTTVIPADALFASLKGYYVFGVKDGKAYKIPVKVGQKLRDSVQVTSGLALGDQFISEGQGKIQAGAAVTVYKIK